MKRGASRPKCWCDLTEQARRRDRLADGSAPITKVGRARGTLLQGSHGWPPGPDRGSRAALRLTRDARLALQAEPGPTPPHPGAEAQGHELARLRREPAPAWQLDGLVFGRGGRGVGGRAAHEPGRAARVFRPGDPDGADVQPERARALVEVRASSRPLT